MKRKFFSLLVATLLPVWVYALGLGNLDLNSGLNQPLDAKIELLYATVEELQNLNISLADNDAFQRAGIDRPFILSNLKFEVDSSGDGPAYILISSRDPVREPFLNFLLEASWSKGHLYREYTILLDPPLYDPNARRSQLVDTIEVDTSYEDDDSSASDDAGEEITESYDTSSITQAGDDYGPTIADDTLWSIARQMRPDSSVSTQQMMLALLRANPEAFLDDNINGLKRGEILRMPSQDELSRYSQSEALAETKLQYRLWEDARGIIASTPTERAVSSGGSDSYSDIGDSTGSTIEETDSRAELKLVVASDDGGAASGQFDGGGVGGGEDLALVNEQLEAISQENVELRDRMAEADAIINDLQRLITLKDDELVALQQQLSGAVPADDLELAEDAEPEAVAEEESTEPQASGDASTDTIEEAIGLDEESLATSATAPVVEAEPAELELVEQASTAVVEEADVPPPASFVDQAMAFAMANMTLIAAALGGLLLIVGLAVFWVKRKRQVAEAVVLPVVGASELSDPETEEATLLGDETVEETAAAVESEAEADETQLADEPAKPELEEDLLAEVNVFLAYEQFDQAEEFVRDAITSQPENAEFHAKLLEVFYAAGNKQAYEEEARILNDLVAGAGSHWDMALAMWAEMSPNRALFTEPVAGEDEEVADTSGGIVDLTADEGTAEADEGLDFDLDAGAGAAKAPAIGAGAGDDDEDVLDLTAAMGSTDPEGADGDEDVLDLTAAMGSTDPEGADGDEDILDLTAAMGDAGAPAEDLLDVSADVGLELDADQVEAASAEEGVLDITGGTVDDVLSGVADEVVAEDGSTLDFDIGDLGGLGGAKPEAEAPEAPDIEGGDADNVIEFDAALGGGETESSGSGDDGLDIEVGLAEELDSDAGLEVDLSVDDAGLDMDITVAEPEGDEIALDVGADAGDDGLEIDVGEIDSDSFSLDIDMDEAGGGDDTGAELDLSVDDHAEAETMDPTAGDDDLAIDLGMDSAEEASLEVGVEEDGVPEIDLDAAVETPAIGLEDDDDDDDDDMRTVFIPRSADANDQSADDEIATKLDLAKAYVELGDKDSAQSILDEVIADGNDTQKQQAQDLLSQT